MQSAGLKTITAKHLSLAAQCLSFLAALLPHLKVHVRPGAAGFG